MPRETATQRRAREHMEAQAARAKWVQGLPMKVLSDMARATELGVDVTVYSVDQGMALEVRFDPEEFDECTVLLGSDIVSTQEWAYGVTHLLDSVQARVDAAFRKDMLRKSALAKLTDEERDALLS